MPQSAGPGLKDGGAATGGQMDGLLGRGAGEAGTPGRGQEGGVAWVPDIPDVVYGKDGLSLKALLCRITSRGKNVSVFLGYSFHWPPWGDTTLQALPSCQGLRRLAAGGWLRNPRRRVDQYSAGRQVLTTFVPLGPPGRGARALLTASLLRPCLQIWQTPHRKGAPLLSTVVLCLGPSRCSGDSWSES